MTGRLQELVGERIAGRFRLRRIVGKGGYGAVFEAEQVSVARRCAVKVLLPNRAHDEQVEQRFRIEARATSRLTHPHTIVVYDFGVDEQTGYLFLATEFLDGRTLDEFLGGGATLAVGPAVSVLEQIAGSLSDAHDHGVVHRDVNPKNVMLVERAGRADFIKVIDFGIAKALEGDLAEEGDVTRTGMLVGTPGYIAPEYLLGEGCGPAADQYALGILGYRMLTGRNPFRAGAALETAMKQINDPPLPLTAYNPSLVVPPAFEDAFLRALEKDPTARFPEVTAFVDRLRETLPEERPGEDGARLVPARERGETETGTASTGNELPGAASGRADNSTRRAGSADVRATPAETPAPTDSSSTATRPDTAEPGSVDNLKGTVEVRTEAGSEQDDCETVPAESGPGASEPRRAKRKRMGTTLDVGSSDQTGRGRIRRRLWGIAAGTGLVFVGTFAALMVWGPVDGTGDRADPEETRSVGESQVEPDPGSAPSDREADGTGTDRTERDLSAVRAGVDDARSVVREGAVAAGRVMDEQTDEDGRNGQPREQRSATVTVTLIPWGTLYIDGRRRSDQTRQALELDPGTYRMSLRQDGEVRARQVVDVEPGQSKMVVLEADFDP